MIGICEENNCTGCSTCSLVCPTNAISMQENSEGFLYPTIDENRCIKCNKCQKQCPVNNAQTHCTEKNYYAVNNLDDTIRESSTSGGVFFELAKTILSSGGIVFGAAWSPTLEVEHIAIESIADLWKLQGPKYVQSNLRDTYCMAKDALDNNRSVLYSGTPCQIAGLLSFLGKKYDNLITVDLVCHGVPSPGLFRSYLAYRQRIDQQPSYPIRVNFRSKDTGWASYSVSYEYDNQFVYSAKAMEDPYMYAFIKNISLRNSCSNCHFKGQNVVSDITLGDCWGIWTFKPEMHDNKGTSLVIINTQTGSNLFETIKNAIHYESISRSESVSENACVEYSSLPHALRNALLSDAVQNTFDLLAEKVKELTEEDKSNNKTKPKNKIISKVARVLHRFIQ